MNREAIKQARSRTIEAVENDFHTLTTPPSSTADIYTFVINQTITHSAATSFHADKRDAKQDASQEAYLALYTRESEVGRPLFVHEAAEAAFDALNHFKLDERKYQDNVLPLRDGADEFLNIPPVLAPYEEDEEEEKKREALVSLIRKHFNVLDERMRQVLALRYGLDGSEGLSQRETAKRLGSTHSKIKTLEKNALAYLRTKVSPLGNGEDTKCQK